MMEYHKTEKEHYISLEPTRPAKGSLILLHGLGADGNDFTPLVSELKFSHDLPLRFIFPHAPKIPVTINNNFVMRAWFNIHSLNFNSRIDYEGVHQSMLMLQNYIETEEKAGIASEKIVLAGFSQGGIISLMTALQSTKRLGGAISLSSFLPIVNEMTIKASPSLPIFIGHGTQDTVVPYALGQNTAAALLKKGFNVTEKSYPIPHTVSAEEVTDIANWLEKIFCNDS